MSGADSTQEQLKLAQLAAQGEQTARRQVNELVHPLIDYQTNRFCQRFCDHNRYTYRCSLSRPVGSPPTDALLCEWGNASYGWMLNDLTRPARLRKYEARNQAGLFDYLYQIANSLPFYERWKDWRFGRKVNVPTYIQSIGPLAKKIFFSLRAGLDLSQIAAQLNTTLEDIELTTRKIVSTLTRRNRLHLLDPPRHQSLTAVSNEDDMDASGQLDVAFIDESVINQDERDHINAAWKQLDSVEQFVLEALVINNTDAHSLLNALREMEISVKKGVSPEHTSVQQLYYFKRKTLGKLGELLQGSEKNVDRFSKLP